MEVCTQIGQGATTLEIPMPMAWSPQKVGSGKRTIEEMETFEDEEEFDKEKDDHLQAVLSCADNHCCYINEFIRTKH